MALFKLSRRRIVALLGGQSAILSGAFASDSGLPQPRKTGIADQATLGAPLNPQTPAEIAAGVTPLNLAYPALNVFRYGATGNGITNDVTAFNRALAVASVAGGAVYVPGGHTYACSTNINIAASNVRIHGDGLSSIISFPDATHRYGGITFNGTSGKHLASAQVDNLQIIGGGYPGPSGSGILTNFCDNVRIFNVTSHEWSDNAFACQVGGGAKNWQIENCTGYNVGQGISTFTPSTNVIITGCVFYNILLYDGIDVEGTGGFDFYAVVSNNIVYNLIGPTRQAQGINIEICSCAVVTGNVVYGVAGGGTGNGNGIHIFGAQYATVTGNVSYKNSGYGIYVGANSGNSTVVGNTTIGNSLGSCKLTDDGTAASALVLINDNNFNEGPIVQSGRVSLRNNFGNTVANKGDFSGAVAVVGTTTAGVGTYTIQTAKYTILDNMLYFYLTVAWSAHTGTGNIQISGLPFTSANTANYPVTIRVNGMPITGGNELMGVVNQSATTINLSQWTPSSGALAGIPLPASCLGLSISGFYPTS